MFIKSTHLYLSLFLALLLTSNPTNVSAFATNTSPYDADTVLTAINEARLEADLVPLASSSALMQAATNKAQDMVNRSYFGHIGPNSQPFWDFITGVNYKYLRAGENLAVFYPDVESLTEAWLNSPSHRANILNSFYTETGIGIVKGEYQGHSGWYVVQLFAVPYTGTQTLVTVY
jgi:uncharacterized protein YkwD